MKREADLKIRICRWDECEIGENEQQGVWSETENEAQKACGLRDLGEGCLINFNKS